MISGLRVIRGPHWIWDNQDGGNNNLGTVIETTLSYEPRKTVSVLWDDGNLSNYRIGYQKSYDLYIFDNAQVGVKHTGIICFECKVMNIAGFRFACNVCSNVNLCFSCYMRGSHNLQHAFLRYDTPDSEGAILDLRENAVTVQVYGIFCSSKVTRGFHWTWNNQDGGENSIGEVMQIKNWENSTARSVAFVKWANGNRNIYCIGHKGRVDLKAVQPSKGIPCYKGHLPILGFGKEFFINDLVFIRMSKDALHELMGTSISQIEQYCNQIGKIAAIENNHKLKLIFGDPVNNVCIDLHCLSVQKLSQIKVGDAVRLSVDGDHVKKLQKGHGEWYLGRIGQVHQIYSDYDLRINFDGFIWTLNYLCVEPVKYSQLRNCFEKVISEIKKTTVKDDNLLNQLLYETLHVRLDMIKELLEEYPFLVNKKYNGKTCLHIACLQGSIELLNYLLQKGASLEVFDNDGDSPLHYAALGNHVGIMQTLIDNHINIDSVNDYSCSALHLATDKQHVDCVKILLKHNADVNIQDFCGDTALHYAVKKENEMLVELLCDISQLNIFIQNNEDCNVFHLAAMKGNHKIVKKIIAFNTEIISSEKSDQNTALHIACSEGFYKVVEEILESSVCNINAVNVYQQTPLQLAILKGCCAIIELLINHGATTDMADENGDTLLHTALNPEIKWNLYENDSPFIYMLFQQLDSWCIVAKPSTAVCCCLLQNGCKLHQRNSSGKTPLDLIKDEAVKNILISCESMEVKDSVSDMNRTSSRKCKYCLICCDLQYLVIFKPCGHELVCKECSFKMKKCLSCHDNIIGLIDKDGNEELPANEVEGISYWEKLQCLENRMKEFEDAQVCQVCMEKVKDVVFLCGHSACSDCANVLQHCHMCRATITRTIKLYGT